MRKECPTASGRDLDDLSIHLDELVFLFELNPTRRFDGISTLRSVLSHDLPVRKGFGSINASDFLVGEIQRGDAGM
jgi:hypothetical protein